MAVELLILSGSRQGESLRFPRGPVSIGTERDCDVAFVAKRDPGAEGKKALLLMDEYGWQIRNRGEGDWYVNQNVLPSDGATPLRNGDIVRLSDMGPDVRFAIVSEIKPLPKTAASRDSADEVEESAAPAATASAVRGTKPWPVVAIAVGLALLVAVALMIRNYFATRPKPTSQSSTPSIHGPL